MSVSLFLITHGNIGNEILATTQNQFNSNPLTATTLVVNRDVDPGELLQEAKQTVESIDAGDGVLILTDLYGATPSNIALKLSKLDDIKDRVRVISGLNLPMLTRLFNYPSLSLTELAEKALTGATDGIIDSSQPPTAPPHTPTA